jgi:ABC-type phosphate transport system substrate-binding protein
MALRKFILHAVFIVLGMMLGCHSDPDEIVRISRQSNSGTFVYFREAVVGDNRELKLGSLDLSGSKDVVEMVATTPNAIGFSGMGYANRHVKMLRLQSNQGESVPPTQHGVSQGKYPLARALYIYVVGEPQGALRHYVDWIRSERGQDLVEQLGYVRQSKTLVMPDSETPPAATIKIAGSDTMVNLAQAWAEEYNQEIPQVRPEVAGGGTGVGIAKLIDGTIQMANASREMTAEEKKQIEDQFGTTVREYAVALDAIAVFVHASNPIEELSIPELAEIFGEQGKIGRWSQIQRRNKTE